MKKNLLIIVAIITLVACNSTPTQSITQSSEQSITPEKKAQSLIKEMLKVNMKDWDSYEEVTFGALDSTFESYKGSSQFKNDIRKAASLATTIEFKRELYKDDEDSLKKFKEDELEMKKIDSITIAMMKSHAQIFSGWSMSHTYRGKNAFGSKDISTIVFFFDKDLTEIINKPHFEL